MWRALLARRIGAEVAFLPTVLSSAGAPVDVEVVSTSGGQWSEPVSAAGFGPAQRPGRRAYAPEAHLPPERRLTIDGSGVFLDMAMGVRHTIAWSDCEAVLCWPDRAEIVLNDEISIIVRAADWHLGAQAIQAVMHYAPAALMVPMPDDPEPEADAYMLRGLATSSGLVLIILTGACLLIALMGVAIAFSDHRWQSAVVGAAFLGAAVMPALALRRRLLVPARWRDAAAIRGRMAVQLDSRIARSSNTGLWAALIVVVTAATAAVAIPLARGDLPPGFAVGIAVLIVGAIIRELRRRGHH